LKYSQKAALKQGHNGFFCPKMTQIERRFARAKRHYIPGYVWHTPVKQSMKRFNGVYNLSEPQERFFDEICQRLSSPAVMAV
jgi:hypothetical protein